MENDEQEAQRQRSRRLSSSTREFEFRLFAKKRHSSVRRLVSGLDFSLSRSQYSREQQDSISLSECGNILPVMSETSKRRLGKRVAFKIDRYPRLSKTLNASLVEEITKNIFPGPITEEGVRYSLNHKDELFREYGSFLHLDKAAETEPRRSFSHSTGDTEKSNAAKETADKSVVFDGGIRVTGASENAMIILKTEKSPTSNSVTPGSRSPALNDIWPWPWLNPEIRAKSLYKSPLYKVTFTHQKDIQNVPLPILGNTLDCYLQSVKACVSASTYAVTEKLVKDFACGEGKIYHKHLIDALESGTTSWIKEFLPNYTHRYSRQEAPSLNLGIIAPFMYDLWPERADVQLIRATVLVDLAVEFWQLIRDERLLPISISKDGPSACMDDFRMLFSSVKLPGIPRDEIYHCFKTSSEEDSTPRHIIVLYKGHIFSMEVVASNYIRVPPDEIMQRLVSITQSVDDGTIEAGMGVGILTSLDRNTWSEIRIRLIEFSENNQACLNEIESAMFVLSLDHMRVVNTDGLAHEALFADGCNRWYDKSVSFYVYTNGLVTVNVNSIVEGSTVAFMLHYIHLRIMEDVEKWDDDALKSVSRNSNVPSAVTSGMEDLLLNINSRVSVMSDTTRLAEKINDIAKPRSTVEISGYLEPRALIFDLDKTLETEIEDAKITFLEISTSLRAAICRFERYERSLFTIKGINTDAFAHMVMQLTFFRMYFRPATIGAKASLRRFHSGRYEIYRTTTPEIVHWCKQMLDPKSSFEDQSYSFRKAEKKHVNLLQNAFSGKGSENHLAALKVIADDIYSTTPKLFEDEGFRTAGGFGKFDIYAECLAVGCTSCAVVWPTIQAGYGIGYFVARAKVVFVVTSWCEDKSTSADLFACSLNRTLIALHDFLRHL